MPKRLLTSKLIDKEHINDELCLIETTNDEYVTKNGDIYRYYGDNKFLHKSTFINKNNGYVYVNIKNKDGSTKQRRVHILVAEAFVKKTDPSKNIVMHKDNNKTNNCADNLQWGDASINTKQAFDDGLIKNDKGFDDSQSSAVVQIDYRTHKVIETFGSMCIAEKKTGITKTAISLQARHKTKRPTAKPKCGYYFRFLEEYNKNGFVL